MIQFKTGIVLLWIAISIIPVTVKAQVSAGIQFCEPTHWTEILKNAKREHKSIFVDAYATWCAPCKKMDTEVYNQRAIGDAVNKKFMAAKFQMDQNKNDARKIRAQYAEAIDFQKKYNINTLPTYLFFDENGVLTHEDIGFKSPEAFLKMLEIAENPAMAYFNQVKIYRNGVKDYPLMLKLYFKSRELKNNSLADSIARDLKNNYFEKLPPEEMFKTQENLIFLSGNIKFYSTESALFHYCVLKLTDSTASIGTLKSINAEFFVNSLIANEEVLTKISQNDTEKKDPDWALFVATIKKKYPFANAEKIVIYPKEAYYDKEKNWVEFAKSINEFNQLIPLSLDGLDAFFVLNGAAWHVFENTGDAFALGEALKWVELAIRLKPNPKDNLQFLDTRANVLYRLGKKAEGIKQEEQAIKVAADLSQTQLLAIFQATLAKMKANQPTWPEPKQNPK
jgi:thioredoxin-related protein